MNEGPNPSPILCVCALRGDGICHRTSGKELWELLVEMSPAASPVNQRWFMCKVEFCQCDWKSAFIWIFMEEVFILKHNFGRDRRAF